MNFGDLLWGMIVGYILLGGVWLAAERAARNARQRKRNRVRSRMSVVRRLDMAGKHAAHDNDLSALRLRRGA